MGTLDKPDGSNVQRFAKVLDIDDMTRPQVKTELDLYLNKGWELISIYVEGGTARAVLVRTKDE